MVTLGTRSMRAKSSERCDARGPIRLRPVSGLGFKLKNVSLYGAELVAGLEYTVSMVEYTEDFSLQVSGLTFAYDSTRPRTTGSISRRSRSTANL